MKDWIQWWDVRKAFTRFDAPQSNLAEVLHAGWKHRDKTGVSLLACCYFDVLAVNHEIYEMVATIAGMVQIIKN